MQDRESMGVRRSRTLRALAGGVVLVLAALGLSSCKPVPDGYAALGDSFTAGPLIPGQSTDPLGCLRSDRNYPSRAFTQIDAAEFFDSSCSGARIPDLYSPQGVTPGPNAPQLDILNFDTKVVTLGIGGNDIGFSEIVQSCATQNPFGSGCRSRFVSGGQDEVSNRIAAVEPQVRQAILDIKDRARRAEVFVVGYPTLLPQSGSGCYPLVPILSGDVPYLRAKTVELNAMLESAAASAGVHFVDLYTPSAGRDMCSSGRWVEGIIPLSVAAPVHPNANGMAAFGNIVAAEINAVLGTE